MTFCGVSLEERKQGLAVDYFPLEVCGLWQLSLADCHLHTLIRIKPKSTSLVFAHTVIKLKLSDTFFCNKHFVL